VHVQRRWAFWGWKMLLKFTLCFKLCYLQCTTAALCMIFSNSMGPMTKYHSTLIIEPVSQWKLNKIEAENCIGIWRVFLLALESPWQVRFKIEFISQCSELRCGRDWFLSGFCCWKFKQIAENWVWKETSFEPSMCVHTWDNSAGYTIEVSLPGWKYYGFR